MLLGWVARRAHSSGPPGADEPHYGSGLPPRYYVPQVKLPPLAAERLPAIRRRGTRSRRGSPRRRCAPRCSATGRSRPRGSAAARAAPPDFDPWLIASLPVAPIERRDGRTRARGRPRNERSPSRRPCGTWSTVRAARAREGPTASTRSIRSRKSRGAGGKATRRSPCGSKCRRGLPVSAGFRAGGKPGDDAGAHQCAPPVRSPAPPRPEARAARARARLRRASRRGDRRCRDQRTHETARVPLPPAVGSYVALAGSSGPTAFGRRTSCGGTIEATTLGVAHPTLPCGTAST